jgi:hypothetical protein
MTPSRRPLTPELASQWAASAQYHFLDALMAGPQIQYEQIAFHGWKGSNEFDSAIRL